jgi:serine/threonine protein kinase
MNTTQPEGRRYRILDLIGRGGFGHVYRARLEGPEGFTKEVALKMVRAEEVTLSEIARFRDEARILGLVRDRAIVGVDPPIRLGGRWALVMEYVDGASAQRLLGVAPFPPRVALEVIQEIARALHKVYVQAGPDGRPLNLLHRDLKPANVQITPEGDVKLLDFGIARAQFDAREMHTSNTIGGTPGYIAPERLRGKDGPESDVFSMGVLLHVLVTTERATELDLEPDGRTTRFAVPRGPEMEQVLALAARMRHHDRTQRPTAREVEEQCAALAAQIGGLTLRQWAAQTIPSNPDDLRFEPDELVGTLLTETVELSSASLRSTPGAPPRHAARREPPPRARPRWVPAMLGISLLVVAGSALLVTGVAIALAAWLWPQEPVAQSPEIAEQIHGEIHGETPAEEPEPVEPVEPAPAPTAPAEPPSKRKATPRTRPEPAPEPVAEPEVQPAPVPVDLVGVNFQSDPSGASVYLNGTLVGRTPLRDHPVSSGEYELRFEKDGRSIVRTVRLGGRRGSTSFTWRDDQLLAQ